MNEQLKQYEHIISFRVQKSSILANQVIVCVRYSVDK